MFKKVRLKPGKEKPILHRHHWIFSGAIEEMPRLDAGEIAAVIAHNTELLGYAYFNPKSALAGRMISFGSMEPLSALEEALMEALVLRKELFDDQTTAYRLVNGEGDRLPGLIIDRYADVFVLQSSTAGMDRLKPQIVSFLDRECQQKAILEKSLSPSRKEEGLKPCEQMLKGSIEEPVLVLENGLKFLVDPVNGQKTGFFLDQRQMRDLVKGQAYKKRVLNCFSYTGGFSVYALAGGAKSVDSVDISESAIKNAIANCRLNGFEKNGAFYSEDAFAFLRNKPLDYDLVILDPPAFAKRKKDVIAACRGYKDINRIAMQKMPAGSLMLTCSCSYFIDEKLFQQVIFQAASESKRNVRILEKHRLAPDHPVNLFHPEGNYLKSLLLFISN